MALLQLRFGRILLNQVVFFMLVNLLPLNNNNASQSDDTWFCKYIC